MRPDYSGRVQIHAPESVQAATGTMTHGQPAKAAESAMLAAMAVSAASLARREIAPRSRQCRKGGPYFG